MKRSVELSPVPVSPPVKVIEPNDVNLFVPPSLASILNELGTSEPLPTEFALIVCDCGVTKISTFGLAALVLEIFAVMFSVDVSPAESVYVTANVIVSVSEVISDAVSVNVKLLLEIVPPIPPLYETVIESKTSVLPCFALTLIVCGDSLPLPKEFAVIV